MSNDFKVESGIEIPAITREGAALKYPWPDMKKGDSFFVAGEGEEAPAHLASNGNAYAERHGKNWKFTQRSVKGGIRVWRVK